MKPHKHAALIKAWADGAQIEECSGGVWFPIGMQGYSILWSTNATYRVKPEPKPDIRMCHKLFSDGGVWTNTMTPNICAIFDGETGALKRVELV